MRSIVYVSLFVARWFAAIGAFRSSLLFRLLDVVPHRFALLLIGFRNFDSTISIDIVRIKSYMDSLLDPTCVPVMIMINKLDFVPNGKVPRFMFFLLQCF